MTHDSCILCFLHSTVWGNRNTYLKSCMYVEYVYRYEQKLARHSTIYVQINTGSVRPSTFPRHYLAFLQFFFQASVSITLISMTWKSHMLARVDYFSFHDYVMHNGWLWLLTNILKNKKSEVWIGGWWEGTGSKSLKCSFVLS
jgi:hypothetical protein